mmetsp:Transcript_57752/g.69470  ORF Transcript_57752/g.69470 Transcript_57752/m.69470 type:complete len:88 (+) Transcript_57752:55-318(+)
MGLMGRRHTPPKSHLDSFRSHVSDMAGWSFFHVSFRARVPISMNVTIRCDFPQKPSQNHRRDSWDLTFCPNWYSWYLLPPPPPPTGR